ITVEHPAAVVEKPGTGLLFGYASEQFPVHAGCPVLSGITKCIEAEAGLALQHNVTITFEKHWNHEMS
ncbi:MAG: hypothetical protein IJ106_08315, partial [Parasporobacterium sp.]|nr:hypothetical protein [Parasporobacterium sp.]